MSSATLPATRSAPCPPLPPPYPSPGAVGYFPSYTLGALMAVQIFEAAQRDLGEATLEAQIGEGDLTLTPALT